MEPETYHDICKYLFDEICQYSPQAGHTLRQMFERTNAKLTYYAAFIIVCLEARVQKEGYRSIQNLELDDLRSYTFFEVADRSPEARDLFSRTLQDYQSDCQRRFALSPLLVHAE